MVSENKQKRPKSQTVHSKRRIRTGVFIVILIIILIGVGIGAFFLTKHFASKPSQESNSSSFQSSSSTSDNSSTNNSSNEENAPSTKDPESQTPAQYEGENPNSLGALTGVINFAGVSEGSLLINVSIDQYVSGNCDIIINNPATSEELRFSTIIIAGPTSGFCSYEGPIPRTRGKWNITVNLKSDHKAGVVTGEMEL